MSNPLVALTKLDAVNICLSSMGEPSINSLDDAAVDAQMASDIVDETTRSVQSYCWHWNKEKHTLTPDTNSEIPLPANIIRVDTVDGDKCTDVVQRGLKLFDRGSNTTTFANPLTVMMWVTLSFDDVPAAAKQFIAARSARIFQQRALGNAEIFKEESADEQKAWVLLMDEEAATTNANVLTDNWSSASIMNRGHFARGMY